MITEYNGHMYPTKRFDQEQRQAEHVTRHLLVLDAVCRRRKHFRLHRLVHVRLQHPQGFRLRRPHLLSRRARYVPRTEIRRLRLCQPGRPVEEVVLQPVTFWARGERNIGGVLPLIILTNCD